VRDELARLDGPDRAAGEPLLDSVETEREAARQRLLEALRGDGYRVALTRLRLPPRMAEDAGAVPLERIARKVLDDLVRAVDRLGRHPDEDELHRLRIALKRTRYAVELAAPAGKAGRRFVEDAKALQALLGEYQDAAVAEQRLRELAVGDARTAASFVAGRIVERQQARRARLAKRLPAAWKRLRRSGSRLHS
jgi:CHAD domain-containing protein